jgi:hypothetical protein
MGSRAQRAHRAIVTQIQRQGRSSASKARNLALDLSRAFPICPVRDEDVCAGPGGGQRNRSANPA